MLLFTLLAVFGLYEPVQCAAFPHTTSTATASTASTASTAYTGSPIGTRNPGFVMKLKEDLRRNNDDYILGRNLTAEPETAKDSSDRSSAYIDDVEEVYRRALVERGTGQFRIRNQNKKKRPMQLYRSANNMIEETINKMGGVGMMGGGAKAVKDANEGKHFFRAKHPSKENIHILSPDQLDMAPARGRKIKIIRNKGRLCQRHVLIPEGPKYDSQGRVYLRAHPPHAARPYSRTSAPNLLLPRCCNCCKKSVLGCE